MNNLAHNVLKAIGAGLQAKTIGDWDGNMGDWVSSDAPGNVYSSGRTMYDFSPGTAFNYGRMAGEYWQNSACQAVLNWIIRAWPESYPCVKRPGEGGKKLVVAHPLADILMNPNAWDDDTTLWGGTIVSLWCDGNAYWRIQRDRVGRVAELDYVPHWAIQPHRNVQSTSIGPDYYRMATAKGPVDLDPWDIVHLRFGRDPYNDLLGMSPWASVSREVYTDNEACNYTATTLRNRGTAWMIVSPSAKDEGFEDPQQVRDMIEARTTGDNRGRVVVLDVGTKIDTPGPLKDMGMGDVRNIPVGRVCALAGIPSECVGLDNGNQHLTFHNRGVAEAAGWNTIVQVQRMLGRQMTKQILWDPKNFAEKPNTIFAGFDYSEVRALEVQKGTEWDRIRNAFDAHLLTDDEARSEMGYDAFTPEQRAALEAQIHAELPAAPVPEPVPVPRPRQDAGGKSNVEVVSVEEIGDMVRRQIAARIPA